MAIDLVKLKYVIIVLVIAVVLMGTEKRVKPYIHSPIARAVYERLMKEEEFSNIDYSEWYQLNLTVLDDQRLRDSFVNLEWDDETQSFIDQSTEKSSWLGTQMWHALLRIAVGWATSKTSLNGWLNRGSMFVLSEKQFVKLTGWSDDHLEESVLDLGAGDGNVTGRFSRFFKETYVTEVSPVMRKLLLRRGYHLKEVESWVDGDDNLYSMISALNLLDRCDKPLSLLRQIPRKLAPNGHVLLAVVFPFSQYVESNPPNHRATELITLSGTTIEEQVDSMIEIVLQPLGYIVKSWARVPYLCEGDLHQPFYWLHDIVFLLQHESVKTEELIGISDGKKEPIE